MRTPIYPTTASEIRLAIVRGGHPSTGIPFRVARRVARRHPVRPCHRHRRPIPTYCRRRVPCHRSSVRRQLNYLPRLTAVELPPQSVRPQWSKSNLSVRISHEMPATPPVTRPSVLRPTLPLSSPFGPIVPDPVIHGPTNAARKPPTTTAIRDPWINPRILRSATNPVTPSKNPWTSPRLLRSHIRTLNNSGSSHKTMHTEHVVSETESGESDDDNDTSWEPEEPL